MKVIGFRPERDTIHWALVSFAERAEASTLSAFGKFSPADNCCESESLSLLRGELQALLQQHRPDRVGEHLMKCYFENMPTPHGIENMFRRAWVEGVIL